VEALQAAILLLPDENREVLQCLLSFLADMAMFAVDNQVWVSIFFFTFILRKQFRTSFYYIEYFCGNL
jgi:hypothetical protein